MRRLFANATPQDEEDEINLTPMLDVVFIMLIFFIVTASFVKEKGIDVNRPDNDEQVIVDPDKANILIKIDEADRIWIDARQVDERAVRANIERLHAENPEGAVIVLPDPESTTAALISVMDSSRQANVYNISIASGK
jgi:biopolymer transport protein ExbD